MDRRNLTTGEMNAARRQPNAVPSEQAADQWQMVYGAPSVTRPVMVHEPHPPLGRALYWSAAGPSTEPSKPIPTMIDMEEDDEGLDEEDDDDEDEEEDDDDEDEEEEDEYEEEEEDLPDEDIIELSYDEYLAMGSERNITPTTGLREEQIAERLRRYRRFPAINGDREDEIPCTICLEDCDNGAKDLGELDCMHEFHYDCISEWLKKKNSCPMCKQTALAMQSAKR